MTDARGRARLLAAAALAGALAVAGCATAPTDPATGVPGPTAAGPGTVSRAQVYVDAVAAADRATAAGQLREALWRRRLAEAVAPDRAAATLQADAAQARWSAAADAADAQGARAAQAGRGAEAQAAYTRVLELDSRRPAARAYMREVLAAQVTLDVERLSGSGPVKSKRKASAAPHRKR